MINRIFLWVCSLYRYPKFKQWILLEEQKDNIIKAVENKAQDFPIQFYAYLSTAFPFLSFLLHRVKWETLVMAFATMQKVASTISEIPLIKYAPHNRKQKPIEWDYDGRLWYLYSHSLAQAYGWDLERIANISVIEAMSLLQEIYTDEQLEKEFLWGTSPNAYSYNKNTKKSDFQQLPKPYWMLPKAKPLPVIKIRKDLMPVGNIVKLT